MTIFLQLTIAGSDTGPFDLYSNFDYLIPFETGVSKIDLEAGYTTIVPDYATTIRITSTGDCINSTDITLRTAECELDGYVEEITTTTTTTTNIIPVTGLTWDLTVDNPCDATPWTISNQNLKIRYDVTDSSGCGGTCNAEQAGTATAIITVGGIDVNMGLSFNGIGELELSNYEKITFSLDGTQIADAHAAGGNLDCQMGPVIQSFTQAPPYLLLAGSTHILFINFTTNDGAYHVGAYYEVDLTFTEI